jgi:hypothetical protein
MKININVVCTEQTSSIKIPQLVATFGIWRDGYVVSTHRICVKDRAEVFKAAVEFIFKYNKVQTSAAALEISKNAIEEMIDDVLSDQLPKKFDQCFPEFNFKYYNVDGDWFYIDGLFGSSSIASMIERLQDLHYIWGVIFEEDDIRGYVEAMKQAKANYSA